MDEQQEIRAYAKILAERWGASELEMAEQGCMDFIDGDPLPDVLMSMARTAMREHQQRERERHEQEKSGRAGSADSAA